MIPEELKDLQKAVKKAKHIATGKVGELHDPGEDRLPAAYQEIPAVSRAICNACLAWAEAIANPKEVAAAGTA